MNAKAIFPPNSLPPVAEMERAYLARDAAYDGLFFLGVRTTGIFCRPTCPARKPLPRNVEYFASVDAARAAGYRACKRCHPMEASDQPRWATELLREVEGHPSCRISDDELHSRGVDPATVRRYFLRRFGMTFQAYTRERRLSQSLDGLGKNGDVDAAVFASGYGSHSGFRTAFTRLFGESPGRIRKGACVRVMWFDSPLGPLIAGATDEGLCLLEFSEPARLEPQLNSLRKAVGLPVVAGTHPHLDTLQAELQEYFAESLRKFSVPLVIAGTEFQQRVWRQLLEIPFGETRSYEDIATAIGVPTASRAVGRANGQNRIALVIPCHRVVNKSGTLGGYGGGLRRKEFLLSLERRSTSVQRHI